MRRRTISVCWSRRRPPRPGRRGRGRCARRRRRAARCSATAEGRLLAIVEERQKRRSFAGIPKGPKYDWRPGSADDPASSRSARLFLPRAGRERRCGGERRSRWSRRDPRAAPRAHRGAARRRRPRIVLGAPARPRRRAGARSLPPAASASAPAASAWSGARTTSCCTARSRSSGSALGPGGDAERATREALAERAPGAPRDRRPV